MLSLPRLDFADLLDPLSGPAVIPSDDRVPSVHRFCAHQDASEGSAVSFCDYPNEGAASPTRALVPWFRIDSVANELATSVPRKPLLSLGNPTASAAVSRERTLERTASK